MKAKITRRNKTYSREFKLEVVTNIQQNNLSISEIKEKYFPYAKSHRNLKFVNKWIMIYETEGARGLMEERRGRKKKPTIKDSHNKSNKTIEELLEENERLRAENEFLKKLDALIQKEKNQK